MITSRSDRFGRLLIWGAILGAAAIGVAVVYRPDLSGLSMLALAGLLGLALLLNLRRRGFWWVWLGLVALSAFGPFLDIVTGQPVNWLLGLFALALLGTAVARLFMTSNGNAAPRRVAPRLVFPPLGIAFGLYVAYYFVQTLRPDVDTLSTLMSFRAPLIGLAGYCLTLYGLRAAGDRGAVIERMRQFVSVVVAVGLVVAAYALFQFIVGFERLQAWGLTESVDYGFYIHNQRNLDGGTALFRIFGTLRRNEVLGTFMYLSLVAGAAALRLGVRPRWLVWANLGLSLTVLLLALSLTNMLVFGLWVGLLVVSSRSKQLWLGAVFLAALGLAATLTVNHFLGGLIGVRFSEHVLDTQQDIGRVRMFKNWMEELNRRPAGQLLFGSGISTGTDEDTLDRLTHVLSRLGLEIRPLKRTWQIAVHDNWYATHSLEVGLVGLSLIWLVFALVPIYILPRLRQIWAEPERGAWVMLALGVLALWPAGFVGALIIYMPITIYFWSLVGLIEGAVLCTKSPPLTAA